MVRKQPKYYGAIGKKSKRVEDKSVMNSKMGMKETSSDQLAFECTLYIVVNGKRIKHNSLPVYERGVQEI